MTLQLADIVSLGMCKMTKLGIECYYKEFKPKSHCLKAEQIHKLSEEVLKKKTKFNRKDAAEITKFMKNSTRYSFNATFDSKFLDCQLWDYDKKVGNTICL